MLEELEYARARGAPIPAEIIGYGMSADGFHITGMPPARRGLLSRHAKRRQERRLEPGDVEYVNAHATSTPLGDALETAAIGSIFSAITRPVGSCW